MGVIFLCIEGGVDFSLNDELRRLWTLRFEEDGVHVYGRGCSASLSL